MKAAFGMRLTSGNTRRSGSAPDPTASRAARERSGTRRVSATGPGWGVVALALSTDPPESVGGPAPHGGRRRAGPAPRSVAGPARRARPGGIGRAITSVAPRGYRRGVYEDAQGWRDVVVPRLLPAPPGRLVEHPGGLYTCAARKRPDGYFHQDYGVILAWARIPAGGWACLLAWSGMRERDDREPRVDARWSWAAWDPALFAVLKAKPEPNPWGGRWFGPDAGGHLAAAMIEAAQSLPAGMRDTAVQRGHWPPEILATARSV